MIPDYAIKKLEELGAVFVTDTSGYIPVKSRIYSARIIEYKEYDLTPILRKLRQDVLRSYVYRNIVTFKEYKIEGILRKICTMYKDPIINFSMHPVKVRNVTFHLLSGSITGEIVNGFENDSKDGEVGYCKTWRWRACPNDASYYYWEVVEGSADLIPNWIHNSIEEQTNAAIINNLQQAANVVKKNTSINVTSNFSTSGLINVIWTLLQIFTSGRVTTRNGFNVTVSYNWKGQKQSISRHIDVRVILPVEGNINWAWD